jgi:outer membrane protein TolC
LRASRSSQLAVALVLLIMGSSLEVCAQMSPPASPITLSFEEALKRARLINPELSAAVMQQQVAHEDRVQARAALLPSTSDSTQYLYTEGNGTKTNTPIFIANNAVHEYTSQIDVHEDFGPGQIFRIQRTRWAEALAKTKVEIARRGLFLVVAQDYYGMIRAQHNYGTAQRADDEARRFESLTRMLENGGEVAHADVIKAQLQSIQRTRDLSEAKVSLEKARVNLAVLTFPIFNDNFNVVDDNSVPTLPDFHETQQLAKQNNLDVRSALAALSVAHADVEIARGTFLPTLSLDYIYGFDTTHFAFSTDGVSNLAYSGQATLNLPIWEWGAQLSKVHQAEIQTAQAKVELSFAQRQLLANLNSFYKEADVARSELQSLHESLTLADDSLRLTTARYKGGEAKVLEVVDAQNTLTQTQNAYDDSVLRYRVAIAQLQTITGGF